MSRCWRRSISSCKPGTVIGLLGRTGSGKTTLARLVFRLYDPTHGHICPGRRAPHPARSSGRCAQRVALVTQDVQLFQASVRDNLTFFDRTIPDDRILEVIAELGLNDWLAGLPNGLDTKLETGGRSISAGEAQLLAFTRVFLRDPGLVILDEASSRLDPPPSSSSSAPSTSCCETAPPSSSPTAWAPSTAPTRS